MIKILAQYICATGAALIGLCALIGYGTGMDWLYNPFHYRVGMAPNTAIAIILLAASMILDTIRDAQLFEKIPELRRWNDPK